MSEMPIKVDAVANLNPLVKEGASLVASLNKGVAKIFSALLGPWVAERERHARHIAEQTEVECRAIRDRQATYSEGRLIPFEHPGSLTSAYHSLHSLNHEADALRLKAAMELAAVKFNDIPDQEISDEPLPQTFFNRWRREAEVIDESELRDRWATLLVEETCKPGSISPRTLDVVSKLSHDEASVFERACCGVYDKMLVTKDDDGNPLFCSYYDCLQLVDAGLITMPTSSFKRTITGKEADAYICKRDKVVMFFTGEEITAEGYVLTRAGVEIKNSLFGYGGKDNLIALAKRLAELNPKSRVSLCDVVSFDFEGNCSYKKKPFWESPIQNSGGEK